MELYLDTKLASQYKSPSQRIRVLTEAWVDSQIFCPSCGHDINRYENNKPVADFYCQSCMEEYELKSKKDSIGAKVLDGAYRTMLQRLESENNPSLFLLNYQKYEVTDFFVIPKHFFVHLKCTVLFHFLNLHHYAQMVFIDRSACNDHRCLCTNPADAKIPAVRKETINNGGYPRP